MNDVPLSTSTAASFGVKPPTRAEDLTAGLLLFFSRPSRLQTWAERWGHPWRHVGITVQTPQGLCVASYSASQCYRVDVLAELLPKYDRIGVASVLTESSEVEAIQDWCATFEGLDRNEAPYSHSAPLLGPLMYCARTQAGPAAFACLLLLLSYCWIQMMRGRRRPSFICSTFALQALVECSTTRLRLPMTAHYEDRAAYATPETKRDLLLARWLCGPGDLWSAVSEAHRSELELDDAGTPSSPGQDPGVAVVDVTEVDAKLANLRQPVLHEVTVQHIGA